MHLPLTDWLARVPKIIILIMTLKILIIPWFGDWEMGKLSFRCFDQKHCIVRRRRMPDDAWKGH